MLVPDSTQLETGAESEQLGTFSTTLWPKPDGCDGMESEGSTLCGLKGVIGYKVTQ